MKIDLSGELTKMFDEKLNKEIEMLENMTESQMKNQTFNLPEKVREFEKKIIKSALVKTLGNQRKAARLLGIKNTTLHHKIKNYGIKLKLTTENF